MLPLWLELQVLILLTYCAGFALGMLLWRRKR
jgi:hypothetical protein